MLQNVLGIEAAAFFAFRQKNYRGKPVKAPKSI